MRNRDIQLFELGNKETGTGASAGRNGGLDSIVIGVDLIDDCPSSAAS